MYQSFLKVSVSYFIFVHFYVGNIFEDFCYVKLLGSKNVICLSQQHFAWFHSIGRPCIFSTTNKQMLNISMVKHQSFSKTVVSLVSVTVLQYGEHHLILKVAWIRLFSVQDTNWKFLILMTVMRSLKLIWNIFKDREIFETQNLYFWGEGAGGWIKKRKTHDN